MICCVKRAIPPVFLWLSILSVILTAGCAVNPVTGKTELSLIPESQEIAIGAEQYLPAQQSQGGLYTVDPDLGTYVSNVGGRVAAVSDRNLPYEFVVLNSSVPNAWALPGGKIAVNRGLLLELNNEAELAAVLGHEVVHAAAKHGANAMQRGMLLQGALVLTSLSVKDSDYANYIVGGAQLGAQLLNQKYGRDAELEADYYGMHYMARAGYDPGAAVSLQETFVRLSEGRAGGWLEGLFSSHPPSQARVDANRETATALGVSGELRHDRYQEAIAELEASREAYTLFDQASRLAGTNSLDEALGIVNRAIDIEPREARFYGLRGDIHFAAKRYERATQDYDRALERDQNYFEYYLGRGLARARLGQRQAARADLQRSNELLPTAVANNELGQLSLAAGDRGQAKQYFETAMAAPGSVGERATRAYVSLDLPENPGKYIRATTRLTEERELIATVSNGAGIGAANVNVEFEAVVNGNVIRRVVTIEHIGAGQQGAVSSGWRFGPEDVLTDTRVRVLGAQIP